MTHLMTLVYDTANPAVQGTLSDIAAPRPGACTLDNSKIFPFS